MPASLKHVKTVSTLIETQKPLVKDEEAADVDVSGYSKVFTSSRCEKKISKANQNWVFEDQPTVTESSSNHDSSQNPRVYLEGIGGSGGDQVNLTCDSPLSGGHTSDRAKGSLNLEALYALCTTLSNRVLPLETVKDAQAKEILTLKARITMLEKRCKPIILHHQAWLRSVSLLSKKKLSKRKSVSKQGRKNAK
nr:hypothetical protein [Tanacetum cinerariifolium]